MKVTAILKNSRWENKIVGEFMGSLHTYELQFLANDHPVSRKKGKSVAFFAEAQAELDTNKVDDETLALLTKNFKKIMKGFSRRNQGQTSRNQGNRIGQTYGSRSTSKPNTSGTKFSQSTHSGQSRDFFAN